MSTQLKPSHNFSVMYSDHHNWLKNWLCSRLGCTHQAADLAHDTFVRVWNRKVEERQDAIKEPRAYLTTIAGGLVVDHFRRRSLETAYLEALSAIPENVAISAEEKYEILQILHRVDEMLDNLPAKVRDVFLMSQLDGLTYAEIAEQKKISVRTVKRYMKQSFCQCLMILL